MAQLRYHLRSLGTTCHGASGVLHRSSAVSYAARYSSQWPRSSTSPGLNFHCFVASSSRASRRSFWVSAEMCSMHLTIVVPASASRFSNSLIAP